MFGEERAKLARSRFILQSKQNGAVEEEEKRSLSDTARWSQDGRTFSALAVISLIFFSSIPFLPGARLPTGRCAEADEQEES
jgi:hypothetical protein